MPLLQRSQIRFTLEIFDSFRGRKAAIGKSTDKSPWCAKIDSTRRLV